MDTSSQKLNWFQNDIYAHSKKCMAIPVLTFLIHQSMTFTQSYWTLRASLSSKWNTHYSWIKCPLIDVPFLVKNSLEYLPFMTSLRGIFPSSSIINAMWSGYKRNREKIAIKSLPFTASIRTIKNSWLLGKKTNKLSSMIPPICVCPSEF